MIERRSMMNKAFDDSDDEIPLTPIQIAKNRGYRGEIRQFADYGSIGDRHFHRGRQFYANQKPLWWRTLIRVLMITFIATLLLSVLLGLLWGSFILRLQKYTFLTQTTKVAELNIQKTRLGEDQLNIMLTLIEPNDFHKSFTLPLLQGNKVILEDEYILDPVRPGLLGLHSGYIIISLDVLDRQGTKVYSLQLNEADNDNSIPVRLVSLLVTRKYGSIALMPSRSIYKICITPTGQLKEC